MKIDTSKKPFSPNGWTIESHDTSLGKIDPTKISLWLHEKQKSGYIRGYDLEKELPKEVLNATVLDWLLKNPKYIPEDWKGKYVFFWGTIYRNQDTSSLCVRYLCFNDGSWRRDYDWLGDDWSDRDPAALLASISPKSSDFLKSDVLKPLELRLSSLEKDMEKIKSLFK